MYKYTLKLLFLLFFVVTFGSSVMAQIQIGNDMSEIDYSLPRDYEIGGITVTGVKYLDPQVLVMISGLQVGETIEVPGDKITNAIRKLWDQGLFEDINITCTSKIGRKIFLNIDLKERPRISKFSFKGVKKSEAEELRKKINLTRGDVATEHTYTKTTRIIEDYYAEKGFHNVLVNVEAKADTTRDNYVDLVLDVDRGSKVRIAEIVINGNEELTDNQVRKAMKETKVKSHFDPLDPLGPTVCQAVYDLVTLKPKKAFTGIVDYFAENYKLRIFKASKYLENNYEDDKVAIIEKYNQSGYRDAYIVSDSVYRIDDKNIGITINVEEGDKYYFRNIDWVGNTKYDTATLNRVLGIRKGDVYNKELLRTNLEYNEGGYDISSIYMDDGYLFFRVDPVEVRAENDSIDMEIRIFEGDQATIGKVSVKGNTKTNDHVVVREMYTKPGQLFSRSDVIRTTRELAALGYFNAETLNPNIQPNPSDGTVDIEYIVEETSSDQIELSAGWGYNKLILTLGLTLNNFSFKNMFKKDAWSPLPGGDGQKLSFRVQTYGTTYLYYGASFTEPWLGGKKPNSFTTSLYHSTYTNGYAKSNENFASFKTTGLSFGLGRRLSWPDDYFTVYHGINLMRYGLDNYTTIFDFGTGSGYFNVISYNISVGRNSVSQPIYPRYGSEFILSLEVTPPYSSISGVDYEEKYPSPEYTKAQREDYMYRWVEFHKWKFKIAWYTELYDKLVLMTRVRFGYLGCYNNNIGVTPFQRFYLGGDGLSNYNLDGREIIGMRGYGNETLTPYYYSNENIGGNIFTKYTMELRYPLSLNPTATIYALGFVEAGNDWLGIENFNPFDVYRSAGLGVRIYLPMFGMLGIDWGYGFDDVPGMKDANKSQFHFSIGGSID
ncbi:MAG: BamA/TamA family outer membrane protein [Bacteroidales bacterium]|nr:BamA/TamA family outer membrane protein [Bacteroidales bacterium]